MSLHKIDKQLAAEATQKFSLVEPNYRNNQAVIAKLKELENEFIPEELKLINELINTTLIASKGSMGLNVLQRLQEASGIDSKFFFYHEPNLKCFTGKEEREFSKEELKLSLLEAILMSEDTPPFIFEKTRLRFPLIKKALHRDACQHGVIFWSHLITKIFCTLGTNLKNLSDEQIVKTIEYINKKTALSSLFIYKDADQVPSIIKELSSAKYLEQIYKILDKTSKTRNYTAEELEKAQRFIAAGGGCASPL